MEFPRIVYRAGGDWQLECGRFSVRQVDDEQAYTAALADGWHLDQYAAKDAAEAATPTPAPEPRPMPTPAPSPVTRAELEAEAKALGVKFDGRVGDKTLAERIATARG